MANAVSIPTECCLKLSEVMKRNWPVANDGFTMRHNKKNKLKLTFWAKKYTNIVLEYTKRCGISRFGGVYFLRKVDFFYIFMRKS